MGGELDVGMDPGWVAAADLDALAPVAPGDEHMQSDGACLDAVASGECGASYRVYRWERPCVSLGLGQPEGIVDAAVLASRDIDLVRRPTGGRALLHGTDLTYAVVLPPDHPTAGLSVAQAYVEISGAVRDALAECGLPAELVASARPLHQDAGAARASMPRTRGACFEEHLVETILLDGRKVCGSAQARRRGAVLQHGSIPLSIDYDLEARLFYPERDPESAARMLERRMIGAEDAAGGRRLAEALARALHRALAGLIDPAAKGGA